MHGELLVAKLRARYPELNPTPGTVPSGTIASPIDTPVRYLLYSSDSYERGSSIDRFALLYGERR